ncbi:BEN domain-containing protein 7 [Brachionichthys hirsutus]|uniref:BEN domain-containing protein 7 n=1 Tax=Brachionichthys hirsutus TaxID=412623 RepID=UPI00360513AE
MEFGERRRRRKSQSFKLIADEDSDVSYVTNSSCKDASRDPEDAAASDVWVGDKGLEIKRQITGMMRLLNDKTGRYQRMGTEQGRLTKEPQPRNLTGLRQPPSPDDHQSSSWNSAGNLRPSQASISTPILNGPDCSPSRVMRILSGTKDLVKANEPNAPAVPAAAPEPPCCMCNCKGTMQAILQEVRAMRRLMQSKKAFLEKQEQAVSPCQPRFGPGPAPRCRPCRRWPVSKVAPLPVCSRRATLNPQEESPAPSGRKSKCEEKSSPPGSSPVSWASALPPQNNPVTVSNTHSPHRSQRTDPQSLPSEVRLAENYDVFISRAQLDSILVNYTRSGSLLFRKLVCAFFDDATLANSLPNGKRKRGLNDNRKGLDQNIVGAIKVFTEKYCTEHRIEKLPGPRDWVQILQDQIKLARRRLKRDAAEVEEVLKGPSTSTRLILNLHTIIRLHFYSHIRATSPSVSPSALAIMSLRV